MCRVTSSPKADSERSRAYCCSSCPSSVIVCYLSEPAENEIRQKMVERHSILLEFLRRSERWQGASQILAMGVQAVSHGVAEESSPRREPWGKMRDLPKPRQGRQTCGQREFPFAASRLRLIITEPTADAVGYLLPLLRSYSPPFSKTDLWLR